MPKKHKVVNCTCPENPTFYDIQDCEEMMEIQANNWVRNMNTLEEYQHNNPGHLIVTVGLPRSGKSTWAKKQGFPIVEPDAIRFALYGQEWWAPGEPMVWSVAYTMVRALFLAGHRNVILDAVSHTKYRRDEWIRKGRTEDVPWKVYFHCVDTPESTCIERTKLGEAGNGIRGAIKRMAKDLTFPKDNLLGAKV